MLGNTPSLRQIKASRLPNFDKTMKLSYITVSDSQTPSLKLTHEF